jgi:hypothetical protein
MVQGYTSRQRSIPESREGPNKEKGGSGIRVPVDLCRWKSAVLGLGQLLKCGGIKTVIHTIVLFYKMQKYPTILK